MTCTQKGKALYIRLSGELDHHRAEGLRETVAAAFENSDCRQLVFDFSEVSFMDSSGIGMVIGRYKHAQERGGSVSIVGMRPEIARIYQISGLAKIIDSYGTTAEAEAALAQKGVAR